MNLRNKLDTVVKGSLRRRSIITAAAVFVSAAIGITIEMSGIIETKGLLASVLPVPVFVLLVAVLPLTEREKGSGGATRHTAMRNILASKSK